MRGRDEVKKLFALLLIALVLCPTFSILISQVKVEAQTEGNEPAPTDALSSDWNVNNDQPPLYLDPIDESGIARHLEVVGQPR